MGLKKIAQMREELKKEITVQQEFIKVASSYFDMYAKLQETAEKLERERASQRAKVQGLNTHGVKEFEDYKKDLLHAYDHTESKAPPTAPLMQYIFAKQKAIKDAVQERLDKMAANFPSEVKPGMVFRFEPTKECWEVKALRPESTNPNLKGDRRIWYDFTTESGKTSQDNLENLKKNYKYMRNL